MKKTNLTNQLRIIGGKWRRRKLSFPDLPNLRPTPDRVRETLFNWLAPVIADASCLDLFAGSGALGFEALSRGAGRVIMIEHELQAIQQLKANQQLLTAENLEIIHTDAEKYIAVTDQTFDIVFLDPPFREQAITKYCRLLAQNHLLKPGGCLYVETDAALSADDLPPNWQISKQSRAGNVWYYLLMLNN